jgi:hypothetical protein
MAAPADGRLRLETVVHRRDRLFEATAAALFTALAVVLMWPLVLICFWGVLGMPWLSLAIGLACTAVVIRWGARIGRGSLERARSTPYLVITASELLVGHAAGPSLARIPLGAIAVVAIDAPPGRQRRADRVRFPVGVSAESPVGWLYCRDKSRLFPAGLGFEKTPNVAIVFRRPMALGPDTVAKTVPGFLVAVTDPHAARAAFTGRVPVRPLVAADLDGICSVGSLPVRRLGRHGLREVCVEDRIRAMVFDVYAIAAFWLLALWLASPALNQGLGLIASLALAWFLYEVPSTALAGQTLGKYLLGLRVVRIENGSARLGLRRATARALLRLLNGTAGAWAFKFAHADALGRLAPGLSLLDGIGAGTLEVTDGEYQRMRSGMTARQRERALTETMIEIEHSEPATATRRAAWISLLLILLLAGGTVAYVAGRALDRAPQPGAPSPVSPAVGPTAPPTSLLPTGVVVVPSSLPTPSLPIPLPTLPQPTAGGR